MHNKKFSEETKLKLDIFRECFREWFPVFVHQKFWNKLYMIYLPAVAMTLKVAPALH